MDIKSTISDAFDGVKEQINSNSLNVLLGRLAIAFVVVLMVSIGAYNYYDASYSNLLNEYKQLEAKTETNAESDELADSNSEKTETLTSEYETAYASIHKFDAKDYYNRLTDILSGIKFTDSKSYESLRTEYLPQYMSTENIDVFFPAENVVTLSTSNGEYTVSSIDSNNITLKPTKYENCILSDGTFTSVVTFKSTRSNSLELCFEGSISDDTVSITNIYSLNNKTIF